MERVKVLENAARFKDVKWLIRGVCALPRRFFREIVWKNDV